MFRRVARPASGVSVNKDQSQEAIEQEWINVLGCGAILPPVDEAERFHPDAQWSEECGGPWGRGPFAHGSRHQKRSVREASVKPLYKEMRHG